MVRLGFIVRRNWVRVAAAVAATYGVSYIVGEFRLSQQKHLLFEQAREIGRQPNRFDKKPQKFHVIMNPRAGEGGTRGKFEGQIEPILQLSGVDYDVFETEGLGSAKEHISNFDLSKTNGILVVGGDGTLQEVVTGLLRRNEGNKQPPVALFPTGSNNYFANHLNPDTHPLSLMRSCVAMMKKGATTRVSVLELRSKESVKPSYALSAVGWGAVSGLVLNKTRLTHLINWDLSLLRIWFSDLSEPLSFTLEYNDIFNNNIGKRHEFHSINFLATTVSHLGPYHLVDDGTIKGLGGQNVHITILPSTYSTSQLFSLGSDIKKGVELCKSQGAQTIVTNEFVLKPATTSSTPTSTTTKSLPFFIDGEDFDVSELHVKVLPNAITFYTGLL